MSGTGAVIGYSLFAGTGSTAGHRSAGTASAALNGRLYGRWGEAVGSGVTTIDARGVEFLRLDTRWTGLLPNGRTLATAGDAITNGLSWTRSIRFGGVQIRRDFSLRPDLVTLPLPSISGSAAVPSSIDLYLNGVLNASNQVGEGSYRIDNLPVVTGAGDARIVTRDIQGREVETRHRFFVSDRQLRAGLNQYSLEAGFARRGYGAQSWNYADQPFVSASARVGMADGVTWEGHGEAAPDLLLAGGGVTLPAGGFGVLSVAGSASRNDEGDGALLYGSFETGRGAYRLTAEVLSTTGDYLDLAATTLPTRLSDAPGFDRLLLAARPAELAARASASMPAPLAGGSLSVSYVAERREDVRYRTVSGYYGRTLFERVSFQASFVMDLERRGGGGLFAGLNMALGSRTNASAGFSRASGSTGIALEATRTSDPGSGELGWRVGGTTGDRAFASGAVQYRSAFADMGAQVIHARAATFAGVTIDGAVVLDHGAFAAPPITGAFAVVDAGVAGVAVRHQNREVGRTNGRGRLLVTDLRAFEASRLSLNPDTLPVDAVLAEPDKLVRPVGFGGIHVAFGVDRMRRSVLVRLVDEGGIDLPVGSTAAGPHGDVVVGYDGLVLLEGLTRSATLVVRVGGGTCDARIEIEGPADGLRRLGPITCRRRDASFNAVIARVQ